VVARAAAMDERTGLVSGTRAPVAAITERVAAASEAPTRGSISRSAMNRSGVRCDEKLSGRFQPGAR
jgi:hypothetical protein